jgi:hypothetical protein
MYVIFWQNALPRPNSSRTISTMSSAWLSSLAKISVLGTSVRPGNISGEEPVAERADDGSDLVLGHDAAIERCRVVRDVVVRKLPAHAPRLPVAVAHRRAHFRFDRRALGADARADLVDLEVHVHAIGHRLLVAVLHDQVLVEKPERVLGRRGGEPDQERVEVLQHLSPQRVDRAVALVDHDQVEVLGRVRGVVDHRQRLAHGRARRPEARLLLARRVELRLALEHGVHALDRGDDYLGRVADHVRGQPLDLVKLR